jgi:uncharacterized membrane-anchored protein YjiN (DUF445 family)
MATCVTSRHSAGSSLARRPAAGIPPLGPDRLPAVTGRSGCVAQTGVMAIVDVPRPDLGGDARRRRDLRRMKVVASALLVVVAVVFVIARSVDDDGSVWGWVEAGAEAAMVGALADWFAVTALFRRPLGLPIPHTAIIPQRKDQIGRSLGEFVEGNFLSPDPVRERLRHAEVGRRLGEWLTDADHAARAADALGDGLRSLLSALDDRDVQATVERIVRRRLDAVDGAPLAARVLEVALEGGHHQRLLDAGAAALRDLLDEHRGTLRDRLTRDAPWWLPDPVDRRLADRILTAATTFLDELAAAGPDHPVRRSIEERVARLAADLRRDPQLAARVAALQRELLEHPAVTAWLAGLGRDATAGLIAATHDRGSELHRRTTATLQGLGARLVREPELRERVDGAVERLVLYVVEHYRSEVSGLIEATVARWDAPSTSRRLELQVGRDLQFIRINGTVVGGLAGLAIHAATKLL